MANPATLAFPYPKHLPFEPPLGKEAMLSDNARIQRGSLGRDGREELPRRYSRIQPRRCRGSHLVFAGPNSGGIFDVGSKYLLAALKEGARMHLRQSRAGKFG